MYKTCVLLLLVNISNAFAQLQNPSFEQTDSTGKFLSWKAHGKSTQITTAQFGVLPFTPYNGNYFSLLESDTQTVNTKRGILEQTFPFADTPGSFSLQYLYLPQTIAQHAQVQLYFSKWNGTSRDTILYIKDTLDLVTKNDTIIPIQWNIFAVTLKGNYRMNTLPDSVWVELQNDNNVTPGKNVKLYLDDLQFGKWAVGLAEKQALTFEVYPNPVDDILFVKSDQKISDYVFTSVGGKQFIPGTTHTEEGVILSLSDIPNGLYILTLQSNFTIYHKRVLICHD
jgi:hypothetical protein